jgi:formylglycine-generating enzyme
LSGGAERLVIAAMRWILPLLLCAQVVSASSINLINQPLGGFGSGNVYNDTRGYSFTTKINPLKITRLGVRDSGNKEGQIGLWREDGSLLVTRQISDASQLEGGYWWITLPTPIVLDPYTTYRIGCQSFTSFFRWRQESEPSVSSAVVINGIVNGGGQYGFAFPSNGPWFDYGFGSTVYTMLVGPNFTFEILPYDTTPPVITLNGANPQTVFRGTAFTDLGATVTDDFDATRTITGSGTVNTSTVGSYTLTYSAQDEVGNVATPITRTVEVVLDPNGDEDNDGLNNTEEATLGTNPYLRDTDSDGVNDLREVGDATDPLDPASFDSLNVGLVAYYPFNGNVKDESGNANHGSANGSHAFPDGGISGKAFRGNGDGSQFYAGGGFVSLPSFKAEMNDAMTLSFWVSDEAPSSGPSGNEAYFSIDKTDLSSGLGWRLEQFYVNEQNPPYVAVSLVSHGSGGVDIRDSVPLDEVFRNRWKHFVVVKTGSSITWFRDGIRIGSAATANAIFPAERFVFNHHVWTVGGSSSRMSATYDDVRVYDRVFDEDEVRLLYASARYDGAGLEGAATKSPFEPATATSWSAGGTEWTVDTAISHDGVDSVKAQTTDGQSTYREYTVTGSAVVDFWWKVSSEELYDTFSYSLNGVNQQTISGEVDWTYRTLTLPEGTHTIRWTYTKDESGAVGQDAGWLDDFVVYPATATLQVRDGSTVLDDEATVDFGSADTGSTGFTKSLTFANEGYVPLEVELSLPEGSPFAFDDGAATYELLLGRGEIVDVPIVLSTAGAGTKTAQLTISAPDSTVAPPLSVTLTGYVRGPDIGLAQGVTALTSGQTFDMGLAPRTVEFTIRNNGNVGDLVIAGISATGNFQITQQPAATIPPQTSTTFKVLAQSVASGAQTGSISITSNAANLAEFSLPLSSKTLIAVPDGVAEGSMATSGTGGAAGWDFGTTVLPSGQSGSALKTGVTPNSGGSVLEFTTQTAGVVSWTWKVSTQENFDWLLCEVDGQEAAGISTKNGVWQTQVVQVPAGANVRWVYRKDGSGNIGEDAGYLADVEFRSFAANQSFSQWAQTQNVTDPLQRMPKSGLQAMFGWLGGFGVDGERDDDAHQAWMIIGSRLTYRYPISKTADGTQQILYSSDMSSWTTRRISQRIVSEEADRVVIEATAPSGTKGFFKVVGSGDASINGMAPIPAGDFSMGDTFSEGNSDERPVHTVNVSAFYMDKYEVTKARWDEVANWAAANGYDISAASVDGKAADHSAYNVDWFEAVKWSNARSEKEGLTPCYTVSGAVMKTGTATPDCNFGANGYRLPTEAEWEKAARGGLSGKRFPWGDTITHSQANYYSDNSYSYDVSPTREFHPTYATGGYPYSSPVGSFAANGYGLHDMSGNMWEWCWDWYDGNYYASSPSSDPRGPSSGPHRISRGGSWGYNANGARTADRGYYDPGVRDTVLGFRCARSSVP